MRDSYMNPSETKRIESFEIFGITNQIHETGIWKTFLRIQITIRIFGKPAYETNPRYESLRFGFASPPAWIRKDSLDSWKQVESLENQSTKRIHETNPRNESFENIKDSWSTIRNEPFWSQDS